MYERKGQWSMDFSVIKVRGKGYIVYGGKFVFEKL